MNKNTGPGMLLVGVGTNLAAMVIVGFSLGFGLDYLIDTTPVFMLLFGIMGFVGGILKAYRMIIRFG